MDWQKSNRDRVEKADKPGIFAFEERASRLENMAQEGGIASQKMQNLQNRFSLTSDVLFSHSSRSHASHSERTFLSFLRARSSISTQPVRSSPIGMRRLAIDS